MCDCKRHWESIYCLYCKRGGVYILYLCNILYIHWCVGAVWTVCWYRAEAWKLLTGCNLIQRMTQNEKMLYLFGISKYLN